MIKGKFHIGEGQQGKCIQCDESFEMPTYNANTCSDECKDDYQRDYSRKYYYKKKRLTAL